MQAGDVPEPLCDPPEHSTDMNNEIDLGNGNDQLMVCHRAVGMENTYMYTYPPSAALH